MSNPIGIATKAGIILLIVALLFTINSQANIRADEDKAIDLSRVRMESISEAMKFYSSRTKHYTTDFDSLLLTIKNDTILNKKNLLVDLSNELVNELEAFKSIPLINSMIAFRKAQREILEILDEINDNYKSVPAIADKNISLYETIQSFTESPKYPNITLASTAIDTINLMSIEIGEYPLQVSANKSLEFIEVFNATLPNAELSDMIAEWNTIEQSLYDLEKMLIDPAQKQQVYTNRYLKHTEIARRNVDILNKLTLSQEIAKINNKKTSIYALKDKFVSEHFVLTEQKGIKGLENEELLLIAMNENTIIAPPTNRETELKFKITIQNNGFGYKIECPNDESEFSRGIFSQRFKNYGNISNGDKSWEN